MLPHWADSEPLIAIAVFHVVAVARVEVEVEAKRVEWGVCDERTRPVVAAAACVVDTAASGGQEETVAVTCSEE